MWKMNVGKLINCVRYKPVDIHVRVMKSIDIRLHLQIMTLIPIVSHNYALQISLRQNEKWELISLLLST